MLLSINREHSGINSLYYRKKVYRTCLRCKYYKTESVLVLWGLECAYCWCGQYAHQLYFKCQFESLTLKVLVTTIDALWPLIIRVITAQWEGMGDVGSARYEPSRHPAAEPGSLSVKAIFSSKGAPGWKKKQVKYLSYLQKNSWCWRQTGMQSESFYLFVHI